MKFAFFIVMLTVSMLFSQGSILIMGGGSDTNAWAEDPFKWLVQKADSGKIINIDTDDVADYADDFISFGADSSSHGMQITAADANKQEVYDELITASGIWIEGGNQWTYVSGWKGTLVEDALHHVFFNGGVVGGTSAGLAVIGEVVFNARFGSLYPENAAYNPYDSDMQFTDDFLEILPNILTDSHFHPRGRIGRAVPMLARRIQDYGNDSLIYIGVDENTAFAIDSAGKATVMGDATVTVLYASEESDIKCTSGSPLTFTDIIYHQLTRGAGFDLKSRSLVETGPYLSQVSDYITSTDFHEIQMDGGNIDHDSLGTYFIKNLTSSSSASWYGDLIRLVGKNIIPNSVVITHLWDNPDYFQNRWIGGLLGISDKPGYRAIYLNGDQSAPAMNGVATISSNGKLKVAQGIVYILDTYGATHQCDLYKRYPNKTTDYRGIVNARLHFLFSGDSIDISYPTVSIEQLDKKYLASDFIVGRSFPNPFNPNVNIPFKVFNAPYISIEIFNSLGQKVRHLASQVYNTGSHLIRWNGKDDAGDDVAAGIYYCILKTTEKSVSEKLILIK